MIRVAILGSSGMLGHSLASTLSDKFEIVRAGRSESLRVDALSKDLSQISGFDYVINCIGVIWQAQNPSRRETFTVNSLFPKRLSRQCLDSGVKLIHVSTDCVFSGKKGMYTENDIPDAEDDYGLSKSLGEPDDCMVLRTSVIGRENMTNRSLLEWVISNKGKRVRGYTNHIWNGITTDEYGRVIADIIDRDMYDKGLYHVYSDKISKYDLVKMISNKLGLDVDVEPFEAEQSIDRSLDTVKDLRDRLKIPSTEEMIGKIK